MEPGVSGMSKFFGEGNSHRDFAVFRYSRNTSTTAGGNTNLRIEAFVLGTFSCIFPFTS